jgi:hypothetical protein
MKDKNIKEFNAKIRVLDFLLKSKSIATFGSLLSILYEMLLVSEKVKADKWIADTNASFSEQNNVSLTTGLGYILPFMINCISISGDDAYIIFNKTTQLSRTNPQYWHAFFDKKAFNKEFRVLLKNKRLSDLFLYVFMNLLHTDHKMFFDSVGDSLLIRHKTPVSAYFSFLDINYEKFSFVARLAVIAKNSNAIVNLFYLDKRLFCDIDNLSTACLITSEARLIEQSKDLFNYLLEKEPYYPDLKKIENEILRTENIIKMNNAINLDQEDISNLSGYEFELLLMNKFISIGFECQQTPKTGDFGADLIVINKNETKIVIQCKRFKSKVNLKAVQEVIGALGHYSADLGVVITST